MHGAEFAGSHFAEPLEAEHISDDRVKEFQDGQYFGPHDRFNGLVVGGLSWFERLDARQGDVQSWWGEALGDGPSEDTLDAGDLGVDVLSGPGLCFSAVGQEPTAVDHFTPQFQQFFRGYGGDRSDTEFTIQEPEGDAEAFIIGIDKGIVLVGFCKLANLEGAIGCELLQEASVGSEGFMEEGGYAGAIVMLGEGREIALEGVEEIVYG